LTPQLLKAAITKGLNNLLSPIQAKYQASKEWQEINLKAYPPVKKLKKQKKAKNLDTSYLGQKETTLTDQTKIE